MVKLTAGGIYGSEKSPAVTQGCAGRMRVLLGKVVIGHRRYSILAASDLTASSGWAAERVMRRRAVLRGTVG